MRGLIHLDSRGQHTLGKMPGKHWCLGGDKHHHNPTLSSFSSEDKAVSSDPEGSAFQRLGIEPGCPLPTVSSPTGNLALRASLPIPAAGRSSLLSHFPWRHAEDVQSQKILTTGNLHSHLHVQGTCFSPHCGLYKGLQYKWAHVALAHLWGVRTLAWIEKRGVQGGLSPLYTFLYCLLFTVIMQRECFLLSRQSLKLFSSWNKPW